MARRQLDDVELDRVHRFAERKGWKFHNGVFVSADSKDTTPYSPIKGVLGYDVQAKVVINFRMPQEQGSYSGPVFLQVPKRAELIDKLEPDKVEEQKGGSKLFSFDSLDIPAEGIDLEFRIRTNHLSDNPIISSLPTFYPGRSRLSLENLDVIPEIDALLNKYGIRTRKGDDNAQFGWDELYAILEGMTEFDYAWGVGPLARSPSYLLKTGEGVCKQFAELFAHLVYTAGGICRTRYTQFLNLRSEGDDIYLITRDSLGDDHVWDEVYLDDRFRVADPTFYVNSVKKGFDRRLIDRFIDRCNHAYVLSMGDIFYLSQDEAGSKIAEPRICLESIEIEQ
jgi:transglutaminase-like putative cysteine protease